MREVRGLNIHFNFSITIQFDYSYRSSLACSSLHLVIYFFACSPFAVSLFLHIRCSLVLHLCVVSCVHVFPICFQFVLTPSVHSLSYVCFSFVVIYFTLILHIFLIYSPFVFHLSSIYFQFILQFFSLSAFISRSPECGSCAVKARISFCRTELIFPSKFPRNRRMDVKAERKVFPKRLCTSDWLLRRGSCSYPNRNARTPTPWYSSSSTSCTYTYRMFNVFIAFPFEPIRNRIFLARLLFRKNTGTKYINNLLNRI